jgi:CheY-like chemotaxis protein
LTRTGALATLLEQMSPPVRVLIADDDPWILRMVANVLSRRGYQVDSAHDGEEALEMALAGRPDLLITDVMMPKMDGWTLVKALRSRPDTAFLPVIFLTALSSDDDRIRGFRLGADDYMAKPFRFEELDLRVERTLGRGRMVEQVAREQLGASAPPPPVAPPAPTEGSGPHIGLLGRLEQVGVSALLILLEMERKTGHLVVIRDEGARGEGGSQPAGPIARITLRRGRVVAAHLENVPEPRNEECIYFLLEWSAGSFEFQQAETIEEPDQIAATTTHLLMEGARRIDESSRYPADDGWDP